MLALHGLGVIAASSDPRRLKMRRRRCGREEAVGGCSPYTGWVSSRRHLTPGG